MKNKTVDLYVFLFFCDTGGFPSFLFKLILWLQKKQKSEKKIKLFNYTALETIYSKVILLQDFPVKHFHGIHTASYVVDCFDNELIVISCSQFAITCVWLWGKKQARTTTQ